MRMPRACSMPWSSSKKASLHEPVRLGRRVGVVGGGNAAVDAARVAARLDCAAPRCGSSTGGPGRKCPRFPEEVEALIEEGIPLDFLTAPVGDPCRRRQTRRPPVRPHGVGATRRRAAGLVRSPSPAPSSWFPWTR